MIYFIILIRFKIHYLSQRSSSEMLPIFTSPVIFHCILSQLEVHEHRSGLYDYCGAAVKVKRAMPLAKNR